MKFKSPSREKISVQIVQQIRSAILSGELSPGEALPCEHDLVEQFGVSKHTLREALRTLEVMGFLSIKRGAGGGPIVSEIDFATAREFFASFLYFQNFTPHNIFEVRLLIEPFIAQRATEKITPEYLSQLHEIHDKCIKAFEAKQNALLYETEVLFHILLAKITDNPVLLLAQDIVNNILTDAKHHVNLSNEFTAQVLIAHEKILRAIEARDPLAARDAMYIHIREVEDELKPLAQSLAEAFDKKTKVFK